MIRFVELSKEYIFKWEVHKEYEEKYGWKSEYSYTTKRDHAFIVKLHGDEFIDWLQNYGLTPDEMFKDTNPFEKVYLDKDDVKPIEIETYELNKVAKKWAESNKEVIEKNPWTVVGMNGGYVLISNGSKENTVELGSASITNLTMDNSNTNTNTNNIKNNPNIDVVAQASLI